MASPRSAIPVSHTRRPAPLRFRGAILLLALAIPAGCTHITISVPKYTVSPAVPQGHLIAGVARVDITPPSGYPMGGHGLGGRFSRGHWGRLYARAFYLRDESGSSVTLVSTDLWGIPAGLHEMVAQLANGGLPSAATPPDRAKAIQASAGNVARCQTLSPHSDIGRRNLLLEATHTHLGPGNYLSSEFYNAFTPQYPGFDRRQFDFLSFRIACAITLAAAQAEMHSGEEATLVWTSTPKVSDLVRNREIVSLRKDDPHLVSRLMELGPDTIGCPIIDPNNPNPAADCLRDRAVDATLTKLTVKRAGQPIGALIFFAAHPLALSDHVAVNSPDFTGFAMGLVERASPAPGGARFVAGFFNGAEGDVTPRWDRQDSDDALRLAKTLSAAAIGATGNEVVEDTHVLVSASRAVTPQKSFCGGALPLLGIATMGGAEDGRSVWFDLGWRSRARSTDQYDNRRSNSFARFWRNLFGFKEGQRPKDPALDLKDLPGIGITGGVGKPRKLPKDVPASVFRIGNRSLATVPFEMTSAAGLELRERLAPSPVLIVGPANEYLSYMTTGRHLVSADKQEYQEQDYEGASTLFGYNSLDCLASLLSGAVASETVVPPHDFDAGPAPAFHAVLGPEFWGHNGQFQDASLESLFLPRGWSADRLPRFEWKNCHEEDRIELLRKSGSAWVFQTDDEEGQILLELVEGRERPPIRREWAALWLPPEGADPNQLYVFRVTPRAYSDSNCDATPVCSKPFSLVGLAGDPPGVILGAPCP